MASREQESILNLSELSTQLLREQEVVPRARVLAKFVAGLLGESAVSVYTLGSDGESEFWVPRATVGEATVHGQAIPTLSGLIGSLQTDPSPQLRQGNELKREDYPHIDTRRTLLSLCYIPMIHDQNLIGALEILAFEDPLSKEVIEALQPAAAVAATAISTAQSYEEERHGTLSSITRITQLYDLEKVFSSTLEMEELLPLIGSKFMEILQCKAVNIWLLLPNETVELMHQAGEDSTTFKGQILKANEGVAGSVSDDGEPRRITDDTGALSPQ